MNFPINKIFWLVLLTVCILTLGFSLAAEWSFYLLIGVIIVILLLFFIKYPEIGVYLMAFFYPFTYWEFIYKDINVPYFDLLSIILFLAWTLKILFAYLIKGQKLTAKNFPGWFLMLLFVATAALSLLNVEREGFMFSLKYIFRPVIFFYLIYVVLPFNIIDNLKKLFNTFKIMFLLGIALSLMGIWSLIMPPFEGIRRAVPIAFFGIYPLGTNHNLLAEIFVCLIPIAFILYWYEKDVFVKNIYLLGIILMCAINLLTLSRAGWITLIFELLVIIILKYRVLAKKFIASYLFYFLIILLTPILYLMYKLTTSHVIISSNLNRMKLIEIALTLFKANPVIGHGIGTYTSVIAQIKWYIIEYGTALEAHGFIFKTLAETGILGTISFLALLAYFIYILAQGYNKASQTRDSNLLLGLFLIVIGGIIFQFFGTGYFIAKLWFPISLALAGLKVLKYKFI